MISISASLIMDEATKHGFKVTNIANYLILEKNNRHIYFRSARNTFQSTVGYLIAKNKNHTKRILNYHNIPNPDFLLVKDFPNFQALQTLELNFPIVIKPTNSYGGKNVFVGIKDLKEAKTVVKSLEKKCKKLILEEMLEGQEYRITCVDYKVVAITMRKPAFVTGDGIKTIAELIEEKNAHPWRGNEVKDNKPLVKIKIDAFVIACLTEQNVNLNSIPESGKEIYLRKNSNISTGGESYNIGLKLVHPDNIKLFEQVTKACDLNVSGIDIICKDLNSPISDQKKAGVIEINSSPGIDFPQFPVSGKPVNVAKKIIEMIDKYIESGRTL